MTVYIDRPFAVDPERYDSDSDKYLGYKHNHVWCHMWADSKDELMAFALEVGLARKHLEKHLRYDAEFGHHYRIVPTTRMKALQAGAVEIDPYDWLEILRGDDDG